MIYVWNVTNQWIVFMHKDTGFQAQQASAFCPAVLQVSGMECTKGMDLTMDEANDLQHCMFETCSSYQLQISCKAQTIGRNPFLWLGPIFLFNIG